MAGLLPCGFLLFFFENLILHKILVKARKFSGYNMTHLKDVAWKNKKEDNFIPQNKFYPPQNTSRESAESFGFAYVY